MLNSITEWMRGEVKDWFMRLKAMGTPLFVVVVSVVIVIVLFLLLVVEIIISGTSLEY